MVGAGSERCCFSVETTEVEATDVCDALCPDTDLFDAPLTEKLASGDVEGAGLAAGFGEGVGVRRGGGAVDSS